jgi:hypothetical protein
VSTNLGAIQVEPADRNQINLQRRNASATKSCAVASFTRSSIERPMSEEPQHRTEPMAAVDHVMSLNPASVGCVTPPTFGGISSKTAFSFVIAAVRTLSNLSSTPSVMRMPN